MFRCWDQLARKTVSRMATRRSPYTIRRLIPSRSFRGYPGPRKKIFLREIVKHKKFITRKFSDLYTIYYLCSRCGKPSSACAGRFFDHARRLIWPVCANRTGNPADQMPEFGMQASLAGNEAIKQSNGETLCCILYNVTSWNMYFTEEVKQAWFQC